MPPGAERREEADSRERKVTIKGTAVQKKQRQIRKNLIFTYLEVHPSSLHYAVTRGSQPNEAG